MSKAFINILLTVLLLIVLSFQLGDILTGLAREKERTTYLLGAGFHYLPRCGTARPVLISMLCKHICKAIF